MPERQIERGRQTYRLQFRDCSLTQNRMDSNESLSMKEWKMPSVNDIRLIKLQSNFLNHAYLNQMMYSSLFFVHLFTMLNDRLARLNGLICIVMCIMPSIFVEIPLFIGWWIEKIIPIKESLYIYNIWST